MASRRYIIISNIKKKSRRIVMAFIFEEPSRTFGEYLLVPGYSSAECIPSNVSLKTPLVKVPQRRRTRNLSQYSSRFRHHAGGFRRQMEIKHSHRRGGISFIYGSQSIESGSTDGCTRKESQRRDLLQAIPTLRPTQHLRTL